MKKNFLFAIGILFYLSYTSLFAQKLGEMAKEKERETFPENSWGFDIMFSEGGFGLGAFLRKDANVNFTYFFDFSISEAKDEREFEYYDPYTGNFYVFGKKHRIFLLPFFAGIHYKIFQQALDDNLRPYLNFAVGPTMTAYNPYEMEFFDAFRKFKAKFTLGGYAGIGANFGLDKKNLLGINIRYYYIRFFDKGLEIIENKYKKNFGGLYFTLNFGVMY